MNIVFDSQMTIPDMYHFEKLCRRERPALAVEVGSWKGLSTSILARFAGIVACIDTWEGASNTPELVLEASKNDVYQTFLDNMRALNINNIRVTRRTSLEAVKDFNDQSVDFVFIDADHAYSSVLADLKAWAPKVKKGGIICGHDCDMLWQYCSTGLQEELTRCCEVDFIPVSVNAIVHPGVTKALWEVFGDRIEINPEASIWWVRI